MIPGQGAHSKGIRAAADSTASTNERENEEQLTNDDHSDLDISDSSPHNRYLTNGKEEDEWSNSSPPSSIASLPLSTNTPRTQSPCSPSQQSSASSSSFTYSSTSTQSTSSSTSTSSSSSPAPRRRRERPSLPSPTATRSPIRAPVSPTQDQPSAAPHVPQNLPHNPSKPPIISNP